MVRRTARSARWPKLPLLRHSCLAILLATAGQSARGVAAEAGGGAEAQERACLTWDPGVGNDCPSREEMLAAIGDVLGHPFVSRGTCETTASGSIRPEPGSGWRVEIHFADQNGQSLGDRSLEIQARACSALKDSLAFVIALMLDTNRRPGKPLRLSKVMGESGSGTTVYVGAAASSGLLPSWSAGATLGLARPVVGIPLRLETTFWFPDSASSPGPGGQFWAWEGGLGLCPSIASTRHVGVSGCLEVVGAVIRGVGIGLYPSETATRPFGAGEASLHVRTPLSSQVAAVLGVGVALPWVRPRFVYEDATGTAIAVHRPHLLIPLASVGVELGSRPSARAGVGKP